MEANSTSVLVVGGGLVAGVDVRPIDLGAFRSAYGLEPTGASLVRPDGYVAWRSSDLPESPVRALSEAFGRMSSATCRSRELGRPHGPVNHVRDVETEHGLASDAPATERAGKRYAKPETTAPDLDSTINQARPRFSPKAK